MIRDRDANPFVYFGLLAIGISLFITALVSVRGEVPPIVAFLCGLNIGAFSLLGLDKSLARTNALRVPETILYLMSLFGGAPGVLLGVHVFKHKTRKAAFQFVLLLIVTAQLLLARLFGVTVTVG